MALAAIIPTVEDVRFLSAYSETLQGMWPDPAQPRHLFPTTGCLQDSDFEKTGFRSFTAETRPITRNIQPAQRHR